MFGWFWVVLSVAFSGDTAVGGHQRANVPMHACTVQNRASTGVYVLHSGRAIVYICLERVEVYVQRGEGHISLA